MSIFPSFKIHPNFFAHILCLMWQSLVFKLLKSYIPDFHTYYHPRYAPPYIFCALVVHASRCKFNCLLSIHLFHKVLECFPRRLKTELMITIENHSWNMILAYLFGMMDCKLLVTPNTMDTHNSIHLFFPTTLATYHSWTAHMIAFPFEAEMADCAEYDIFGQHNIFLRDQMAPS